MIYNLKKSGGGSNITFEKVYSLNLPNFSVENNTGVICNFDVPSINGICFIVIDYYRMSEWSDDGYLPITGLWIGDKSITNYDEYGASGKAGSYYMQSRSIKFYGDLTNITKISFKLRRGRSPTISIFKVKQ